MEMYFKRMKDEWTGLVEQADPPIRAKAAEIAVAHAHYLSIEFYRIVRIDPHAEEFLSNEQVERQLKSAMERWIINVLSAQVDDVERLIQIQHTVEGTQFVLVSLENDVSNITQIADELRNVVSKPIMIDDKPFPLTLSIGISYDLGKNRDYLLSTAHNAMDYIRKNGGNGWQFFSPAMNEMVKERLVLGAALKEAISNNQLKLVYQPQIFAETGELYGIEALARWHDPLHGHVPPSRFIPLAEEIGEIENIGRWVIAEACRQLAEWRSQNIHIPALSVNLSALHFRSNQLPNQVSDAMHAWGIDGHQLTVEITESVMMEHDTEIFKRIQILRDMGVGLSVDDFGTGFSGLSRLVSLPVTEIKIDKSFVDRCLTEKRILALLEAITSIGQSLNLTVVAEGVETKEQFEMLRKIHCRVIQGYFFSRPLPAEEIPGWMSSVLPLKI